MASLILGRPHVLVSLKSISPAATFQTCVPKGRLRGQPGPMRLEQAIQAKALLVININIK